jgi:hypothetical protein
MTEIEADQRCTTKHKHGKKQQVEKNTPLNWPETYPMIWAERVVDYLFVKP